MPIINNAVNFNPNQLNVPGLYVVIKNPPGFIKGAQSQSCFIEGTASFGKVNVLTTVGSIDELTQNYLGVQAASYADPYDLVTAAQIALAQAGEDETQSGTTLILNRISDGTDAAATINLPDTTGGTPLNFASSTMRSTGSGGNGTTVTISASATKTGAFRVDIFHPVLGAERFDNIVGGSAGVFANNFIAAINNGQGSLRARSNIIKAASTGSTGTSLNPAPGTYTLVGGTDGRGVSSSHFVGSATADPPTGIYSLNTCNQPPSVAWCQGLTDSTVFTQIQALLDSLAIFGLLSFPAGTDVATAVTATKTLGIDTPNIAYCKDWVYWYDSVNGKQKLVDPAAFIGGRITALSPEQSPLNKSVAQVIGTERMNGDTGMKRYSPASIGQMNDAGILVITNPVPGGNYWGLPVGQNSCSDLVRKVIEYARMTNWLAHTFDMTMGKAVGELQTDAPDDALRALTKQKLDSFLSALKTSKQISGFKVVCDLTNNSGDWIARHFMKADVFVRYASSVQYFIISLQGGTTVSVDTATITQQQAQQIGV